MTLFQNKERSSQFFQTALIAVGIAALLALFVYAYLGVFTRYIADDYCHARVLQTGNVIELSIDKYMKTSNRYSNMLLFGFSELFGAKGVAVLPPLMIFLWLLGLFSTFSQLKNFFHVEWQPAVIFAISALLAFFTILQAPNLYQSIYWRSGLVTYFSPLVFSVWLIGFIFSQIRRAGKMNAPLWASLFVFLAAFLIGGLSETAGALHSAALILSLLGIWRWGKKERQKAAFTLVGATLAGALLSLLTMGLAPANAIRLDSGTPELAVLLLRFLKFPFDFIWDTLKTLPLPSLISIGIPYLIFYGLYVDKLSLGKEEKQRIWLAAGLAPLIMYALIAASFAPSAYGQSYPVERARFPARFIMTGALMLEGALFGILASQIRLKARAFSALLVSILLGISAFYPLRAAWQVWHTAPEYQARAAAWDARDAQIRADAEQGALNIQTSQLPGIAQVKELDVNPKHWINRCATEYYGVDSIRAIP